MTQAQVEAWIAQNGGPGAVQYAVEQKRIANPTYNAAKGPTASNPEYVMVEVETWKNTKSGAILSAKNDGSGTFEVYDNVSADPNKPTAAAGATAQAEPPKEKEENGRRYVWKPNPGGPNAGGKWEDVGPAAVKPEDRVGKPTGNTRTTSKNGQTVKETEYQLPDGSKEWRSQTETGEPDRVGKPSGNTRQRTENGQSIKEVEYVLPDGTKEWRAQTAPDSSTTPDPTDMPTPSLTVGDAASDLAKFEVYLAEKVRKGELTIDRADQLRKNRLELWRTAINETQGIVNTQQAEAGRQTTERGQTLQDLGNRRTSATSLSNTATQAAMDTVGNAGAGAPGGDFLALLRYARNSAQDFVNGTGANREVPVTQPGPMLTSVNSQGPRGTSLLNPRAPFLAPPTAATPAPPSGAEVEAARQTTMNANRAATAPLLAPPPPVAGPNPATPNLVPPPPVAVPPPASVVPAGTPNPGPVPGQDPSTWAPPPAAPADPNAPNGAWPAPPPQPGDPSWNTFRPAPSPLPPGEVTMAPPQSPGFLSAMRPGSQAYDPTPSAMQMIADPNWDNEAVKQAYLELYGRPLQVA